jgi:hypothetical protein
MQTRRIGSLFSVLPLLMILMGCHTRDSIVVHITKDQMRRQLASRFPIEKRELFLRAVFSDPQILLTPGSDRIGVGAATLLELKPEQTITGRIALDGQLRYVPESGQLFLKNIRLVDAHIDRVSPQIEPALKKIGGLPTVKLLFGEICKQAPPKISDVKLGQLPDNWKGNAARSAIRSVTVEGDGLDVEFGLPH